MTRRLADRRGRPRFEIVGELWGTLDTTIGMPLRDVSRGGALVHSGVSLGEQSVHHVGIRCEGGDMPASVRVQHVRPAAGPDGGSGFLIGFEFITLPAELSAQIERWLTGGASPGSERTAAT